MRKIQLKDIYNPADMDDEFEALFHEIDERSIDGCFEVTEIPADDLRSLQTYMGDMSVIDSYHLFAEPGQDDRVTELATNFDEERVIVIRGNRLIDGNHHLVAAHKLGRPVQVIDLDCVMESDPYLAI